MTSNHTESSPNPESSPNAQGMGCAIVILAIFFVLQCGMLASVNRTTFATSEESPQVAVLPTEAPTSTPVPPTATLVPPTFTATVVLPTATVAATVVVTEAPTSEASGSVTGLGLYDPAVVTHGQELYMLCAACHGPDARGLPNLGKDLVTSEFLTTLTDQQLHDFIVTGRPMWDPLNTTGIDMPPRGGNPALSDDEIFAIIAYIRVLRGEG